MQLDARQRKTMQDDAIKRCSNGFSSASPLIGGITNITIQFSAAMQCMMRYDALPWDSMKCRTVQCSPYIHFGGRIHQQKLENLQIFDGATTFDDAVEILDLHHIYPPMTPLPTSTSNCISNFTSAGEGAGQAAT